MLHAELREDGVNNVMFWDESMSSGALVPWVESSGVYMLGQHKDAFLYYDHNQTVHAAACSDHSISKVMNTIHIVWPCIPCDCLPFRFLL